jgi:hypothetical protein
MSPAELRELAADIRAHGQQQPCVMANGLLLDGRNRWQACAVAGVVPRTIEWEGPGDPVSFVLSANLKRRHLTPSQRAMVAARAKPLFQVEAERRMLRGKAAPSTRLCQGGKAAFLASRVVDVSCSSVETALRVLRSGVPDLARAVDTGTITVSQADRIARLPLDEQRTLLSREDIRAALATCAENAERPWDVGEAAAPGTRGALGRGQYVVLYADPEMQPDLTPEVLCNLSVSEAAAPNAIVFFRTGAPRLEVAMEVLSAWGFLYQTCLAWLCQPATAIRQLVQHRHELVLVAVRGVPPSPSTRPSSVIEVGDGRDDALFALVEAMYPKVTRLDLFGMRDRPGWDRGDLAPVLSSEVGP